MKGAGYYITVFVIVQYNDIKLRLSAVSVSFRRRSPSRVLRGVWSFTALCCDLASFFFGDLCDYRQFLIWWRLRSFVMIIAEFCLVIGCERSMALDSPPVVWPGQTVFSSLNEASPLSIHPFCPYSLLSLSPS